MKRKENLIALRDAVVSGEWKNDGSAYRLFGDTWLHVFDAYSGDMNAALAFVAEVLPVWNYEIIKRGFRITANVGKGIDIKLFSAVSETPARALLIAALNALIEETDE